MNTAISHPDDGGRYGMSSERLAELVESTVQLARQRVMGTGRDQYDRSGEQRFERLTLDQLHDELDAEILDAIVYLVMLRHLLHAQRCMVDRLNKLITEAAA